MPPLAPRAWLPKNTRRAKGAASPKAARAANGAMSSRARPAKGDALPKKRPLTEGKQKRLLVSILSLGQPQNVSNLIADMPSWLAAIAATHHLMVHLVVRNNDPNVSFDEVSKHLADSKYPALSATVVAGEPNLGFGRGHNENFRLFPSDYFLILNDDLGFPHMKWLPEAIDLLEKEPCTACVGASESPQFLSPMFGNGLVEAPLGLETLKYAEASVLLFNSDIFRRIGMFDELLQWAMCEDADLSLRSQQLGYQLRWICIPHQHWRSSTFDELPVVVKSSILEHNRAILFASWGRSFATGRIGRNEVFDIWSDGMGDVFCALPHLLDRLSSYTAERRSCVIVNTSHPDLVELLGLTDIRILKIADERQLLAALDADGVTTVHTIRDLNYALPLNIHTLLSGALNLPACDADGFGRFATTLLDGARTKLESKLSAKAPYCVVHLEFDRDHDGRAPSPAGVDALLNACCGEFDTLVLVGKQKTLVPSRCQAKKARVVDMQGKLSTPNLISVIAGADYFVGIDSFPAHVAQAMGVRSGVVFGAIHPLARVWSQKLTWPIVADVSCLGCYHTQIELSVPFCMRRDDACMTTLERTRIENSLVSLKGDVPYSWDAQKHQFERLQGKWIGFMRHHPAPPERMLRKQISGNQQISNLIYDILDKTAEVAATHSIASNDVSKTSQEPGSDSNGTEQAIQIIDLPLMCYNCDASVSGRFLDVVANGKDPQIILPPMRFAARGFLFGLMYPPTAMTGYRSTGR